MIALFETLQAAQAYCDDRARYVKPPTLRWDVPRLHPSGDGRAWCSVDQTGPIPVGATIVDRLPAEWIPEGPSAKAARMTEAEAALDPDPFVLELVRATKEGAL